MTETNEAGDVVVVVRARAAGPGLLGDAHWTVEPDQSFGGHDFEHWLRAAEKKEPVTLT